MSSGSSLAARFVLLRDTQLAESPDTQLPAGSLVQEIKNGSDKPDQLLLQSLEPPPGATGGPAFVLVPLEQLQEVSKFLAELLSAEKHHKARLGICRDENWLEEAVHVVADTEVYVSFGQWQLLGFVHWTGVLPNLPGKWFGVEVYPSDLLDLSRFVQGGDGSPKFKCEPGYGVYVAITQLRLATLHLDEPFPKRGKKAFSVRTTKAAEIEAAKKAQTNGHVGSDHTNGQSSSGFESMDWEEGPQSNDTPLAKNDRVVWFGGKEPARGTVVYVGKVSNKMHNAVAIEFDQAIGDKHFKGMNNDHAQFTVSEGYGKVVELHEVMREKDYGLEDAQHATEPGEKKAESKSSSSSSPRLNDRVVWFGPEGQARALVVYFDKVPGMEGKKFGLRLDERKGDKKFKGVVNGKDLFHCGPGYGVIVDATDIMLERLFDGGHEANGNDTEKEVAIHDHIFWLNPIDDKYEEGAVRFIGEVARKKKAEKLTYIGVEFENSCGEAGFSGKVNKVQLFKCKQNHGMLLPMSERRRTWFTKQEYNRKKQEMTTHFEDPAIISSKLISPVENNGEAASTEKTKKNAVFQEFTTINNHKDLTIGQRVLAISAKAGQAAQPGKILWMGTIASLTGTGVLCGLEMDDKVGSVESVTHCGYFGSDKKGFVDVFACKPGHGQFVPVSDVLSADAESASEWQQVKHHRTGANPAHPVRLPSTLTFEAVRPPPLPPLNPGQTVYPPSPSWQNGHGLRYPNSSQSVRPPFSQMMPSLPPPAVERHPWGNRPWMSAPVAPQPPQLALRQTILTFIGNKPVKGVVVYVGQPHFAPHQTYVGILMFEAGDGTTIGANGFVDGTQYFECLANHGLMCLMDEVHAMDLPPARAQVSVAPQQPPTGFGFVPQANGFAPQANGFAAPSRPSLPHLHFPVLQRPSVQSEESVRAAIQEADRLERLENERKSHVAIFSALAAENLAGVEVTIEVGGTKGNVEICPRIPRLFDGEGEFSITSLTTPEVLPWCAAAGFEPKKMKRSVEYLPPLVLQFELTEGFPDRMPPVYHITCNWLSPDKIVVLRKKLVDSWKETVRQTEKNILFEAAKLLRYDLLSVAGLEFGILYYSQALGNFDLTDMEPLAGRCVFATDREVLEAVDGIIAYNDKCSQEETDKAMVECPICITSYPPTQFNVFSTICSHMFCIGCVTNHAKTQVEDNKGDKIQCMQDGCKITVPLHELSDLIEPSVFEQLNLYVNNRLYDEMADVKQCPQCKCPVIYDAQMLSQNQRYITCPNVECNAQYCPHCGKSGHGDQPCLTNEQKTQLRQEYQSATAEAKQALEQRYGAENIRHAIEDFDSEELIRSKMKACPSCKSPVEKIEGCNKMICTRCNSFFCYTCGIQLPTVNPYSHFDRGGCRKFDHQ